MLIQVIRAHPLTDSYNHALFRAVVESLREAGHETIATDLYELDFDPRLTARERSSYFAAYDWSQVETLVDTLRHVDGLVFVFPHWWFSMPAILKGYFDRVWAPGIAFEHDRAGGRIVPLLTRVKLFAVVTTFGSPWWLVRLAMGDPGRRTMLRGIAAMCPNARKDWIALHDLDRVREPARKAFLDKVRRHFARIG